VAERPNRFRHKAFRTPELDVAKYKLSRTFSVIRTNQVARVNVFTAVTVKISDKKRVKLSL
jgi:hypothetical protein